MGIESSLVFVTVDYLSGTPTPDLDVIYYDRHEAEEVARRVEAFARRQPFAAASGDLSVKAVTLEEALAMFRARIEMEIRNGRR